MEAPLAPIGVAVAAAVGMAEDPELSLGGAEELAVAEALSLALLLMELPVQATRCLLTGMATV